jgi:hypothetical protein
MTLTKNKREAEEDDFMIIGEKDRSNLIEIEDLQKMLPLFNEHAEDLY